jgi:hypothetical protein
VNPVLTSPDQGIADFLETPRFSTGYAALHHCIGFMPETHMLKPFADRYASMRALVESVLQFTIHHAGQIQALRRAAKSQTRASWPVQWETDFSRPTPFLFDGYTAVYQPSKLGNYLRLAYDRSQPWQREILHFNRCLSRVEVDAPQAYVIPQQWRAVIERLQMNGIKLERLSQERTVLAQTYRISHAGSRATAYEGHMFHDEVSLCTQQEQITLRAGDYWLAMQDQPNARYAVETLEPQAHDSFFRWGFFNSVLEKKEAYSDYVFEDHALELLQTEPTLSSQFEAWKAANPDLLGNQTAVLDFIFSHCERYREPEWRRYPVLRIMD